VSRHKSVCLSVCLQILNSFNILMHLMLCFKFGNWVEYGRVHVLHCETQQTSPLAPLSSTANLALCPTGRQSILYPVPNCQTQQTSPHAPLLGTTNLALCPTVKDSKPNIVAILLYYDNVHLMSVTVAYNTFLAGCFASAVNY